jgi:integrase
MTWRCESTLLLRWTGLRGSDVVGLIWNEVHLERREIERVTEKRKKKVIVRFTPNCLSS